MNLNLRKTVKEFAVKTVEIKQRRTVYRKGEVPEGSSIDKLLVGLPIVKGRYCDCYIVFIVFDSN